MKRVLTFGCFDLFHAGHVAFLGKAKTLGSLIVAIGDDARVRELKGEGRPIMPQEERLALVGTCAYVDRAFIFEVDKENVGLSHIYLVQKERPDIVVSGESTNLDGRFLEYLKNDEIEYVQLPSQSPTTTEIIQRIQQPEIGCPEEVAEHLAGYEVSQDPSKGAQSKGDLLCPVCYHYHKPIVEGGIHLD